MTNTIWRPFTQEKGAPPPIKIDRAKGAYLFTNDGKKIFDGISSWWVNLHGHANKYIAQKMYEQALQLEHVIFAGFSHHPAETLSERLMSYLPTNMQKIFFSDNGSTAVEVAIKQAIQYWHNIGRPKTKMMAFNNAYHGDTFGAMSVAERGPFNKAFWPLLFDVVYIDPPDRFWSESQLLEYFNKVEQTLEQNDDIAGFIFEPIVQGAGGMLMQDIPALEKLLKLVRMRDILLIADEVMTGFGRTGKFLACDHLDVDPDFVCVSKGITGGTIPLGVTITSKKVYEAFYSDDKMKAFYHGHSYTANPICCATALASLDLYEEKSCEERRILICDSHQKFAKELTSHFGAKIERVRHQGTILAFDLATTEQTGYFNSRRDQAYQFFLDQGVLLRPLGNVIYILPPYCSSEEDLKVAYNAITKFLEQ